MHIRAHECSWMLMSSHQHSWAWCQDTHEPEWVLIGNHEQSYALLSMVPWHSKHSWALMSSNEHSRALLAPWQLIHNCSWVPTNAHERSWVLKTAHYCSWLLKSLIKKSSQNVNFLNDHPVVICKYLGLDFTKWYKCGHFQTLHGKGSWKMSKMKFLDP